MLERTDGWAKEVGAVKMREALTKTLGVLSLELGGCKYITGSHHHHPPQLQRIDMPMQVIAANALVGVVWQRLRFSTIPREHSWLFFTRYCCSPKSVATKMHRICISHDHFLRFVVLKIKNRIQGMRKRKVGVIVRVGVSRRQ